MTAAVFSILGGLGLFLYGLRTLLRRFESFASSRVRPAIQGKFTDPLTSWLSGVVATLLSQSSNLTVISLMGLTEIGFIPLRSAYFAMLGAGVGTTAWLWMVLSGWYIGPILVGVGAVGLLLSRTEYWEELISAFLSVGLTLMGVAIVFSGSSELLGDMLQAKVSASAGSAGLDEQLPIFFIGTLLGLLLQSASAPLVLLLAVAPSVSLATGVSLFLGANFGLTVTPLLLSWKSRALTKRLAWSYFFSRGIGVLGTLFLFYTFLDVVVLVAGRLFSSPTLLTQLVTAQLLFSLINSLVFTLVSYLLLRLLAVWLPEKEVRVKGLARRVRRMLIQDPILAAQECNRQIRALELEAKSNYDRVLKRLTSTDSKDTFRGRAMRERNFRALKFTIHELLFAIDRHRPDRHQHGIVVLSLLEYYGALTRTLFHLEDHYEKGLSKRFKFPDEMIAGLEQVKSAMDNKWAEILLEARKAGEPNTEESVSKSRVLEEIILQYSSRSGTEYQGYATWLMETAGFLSLTSSDLDQLVNRRAELRDIPEA